MRVERDADLAEQLLVDGFVRVERVDAEDQRRGEEGDHRRHQEPHHGQRHDDVRRLLVVAFLEVGEQRHEGGRHDAPEQHLVHDVRRLVADAIGVGQGGLPDHVAEGGDASKPGDA